MIKIFLGTLFSVLLLVILIVIFYWRDVKYDPNGQDFVIFFGLIPLAMTLLILSPVFIKKIYQKRQEKKELEKAEQQQQLEQQAETVVAHQNEIEWIELNVLSVKSLSALAENEDHINALQEAVSPELDSKLLNAYGLPILSFRIQDIEDFLEENEEDHTYLSHRQKRIMALIRQQLEQNTETLFQIATHLKDSAMFYDTKLAQEYRMHPAWIDPNSGYDQEEAFTETAPVIPRLNRLNIHIILPENLFHVWDESLGTGIIQDYLNELGIISQQFDTEYHYWGETTAYKDWIKLLKRAKTLDSDISLFIAVDSEIDQETIDDRTWMTEKYVPSEYISSCFLTAPQVEVRNLTTVKQIKIALNIDQAAQVLKDLELEQADQYEAEQPFVFVLDDQTEIKSLKKLEHNFANTPIEVYHYLYSKNSLGHTQSLSKVFGFMLSLHIGDEMYGYVYSADHQQTQVLVKTEYA